MDQVLAKAAEIKASDGHIVVGNPPMFRHLRELKKFRTQPISTAVIKAIIHEIFTPEMQEKLEKGLKLDFCY